MGTNPAVSLPDADRVRAGSGRPRVVHRLRERRPNDTLPPAHVRLPAAAWGRRTAPSPIPSAASRASAFLPGDARPDWAILADVGRRLAAGAFFAYASPADIFREHARLSGFENGGASSTSPRSPRSRTRSTTRWPRAVAVAKGGTPAERMFANGGFATPSGARFIKIAPARLAATPSAKYPFVLSTGRVRDQWHTMTRTGLSPRLSVHVAEPFVEIHPRDAAEHGFAQGTSRALRPGTARRCCVSCWRGRSADRLRADPLVGPEQLGRVGALVQPATDPSRQPEAKATPAAIAPEPVSHYGFVLTRTAPAPTAGLSYRAQASCRRASSRSSVSISRQAAGRSCATACCPPASARATRTRAAGSTAPPCCARAARGGALPLAGPDAALARMAEKPVRARGDPACRAARPARGPRARRRGRTRDRSCACAIRSAASASKRRSRRAPPAGAIGDGTRAGTNCGSCVPELKRLLDACRPVLAAE